MINLLAFHVDDVTAVEDDFPTQFLLIFYNLGVLDHNNHEVNVIKEFVKIVELVLHNITCDEWVVNLQRTGKVAFL